MNLRDANYDLKFENAFLRAKADEFQSLFERVMGLAYKADFMPCRPWGNQGDKKNDGFLKSERRLFQVYAPAAMDAKKAIAKITEDFNGAKGYWRTHFDRWTFVHNATEGLPPHVQKVLLELESGNPGVLVEPWGLEELRVVFRRISPEDLSSWLGTVPDEATRLGYKDLQVVLESLGGAKASLDAEVKVVPPRKIEANALSEAVATLVKSGMAKAHLVSSFLGDWHDETLGERLAVAFRAKYDSLRTTASPNEIFYAIQTWAGGSELGHPEHQLAVQTVMAYFFERCDIFEAPRAEQ